MTELGKLSMKIYSTGTVIFSWLAYYVGTPWATDKSAE